MNSMWTWIRNGIPVVTTPEGVDTAVNDFELREKLLSAVEGNPVVVVDGSTCGTFFSVSAMRVLDEAGRRMIASGGELRLVTTRPRTPYFLDIVGYGSHLRIFRDLDPALEVPQQVQVLQPEAA